MDQEQIRRIIDSPEDYDESKEDTLLSMVGQLYSRRMLPSLVAHGAYASVFIVLAVFCGIRFFDTEQVQYQMMYAAIFICSVQFIVLRKVIYWQMLHKNNISREIKRLELRIAELSETIKEK
ncbi:MAG: hypothetical protein JSU70_15755 [Phycisphaerales bacterium]|nr:MAG: hypothetical protein JSU70_15755 [Phycisphaerales bacterium]